MMAQSNLYLSGSWLPFVVGHEVAHGPGCGDVNRLRGANMRTLLQFTGWVCAAVLVAVLICFLYAEARGGSYPSYAAADFARLSVPGAGGPAAEAPVAQTEAG